MASALCDMRIVVIEDVWIVAQSYVAMLDYLRVIVAGPAGTVADALKLVDVGPIDAALVDMNLHGEMAHGVVEQLNARGVPVVIVTGYDLEPEFESKVTAVLKKPIRVEALIKVFREIAAATKANRKPDAAAV